ncbi:MAG: succinate dehydrogenase/fumarate reductase iron-sulfur subunit [candidate division NC10 bacterium]|nr:succinate dehydrogenase/fumarate reductase iron-sulfur subunit [candidate division NC10 bacterium]MBI3002767.1 succinate dehydrogenase/fumarate reductase iron-sulfur subunit [candidate division NC10 bacterium]MBI4391969.1 succinate dehydrogenase/fumarate reductase iron-sulfur subunit [candidate division NC10 bacterium]
MAEETITLEVTRYRPREDREPRAQAFTVPYRKDWVVLDALNHIKDRVDGTLTYRWSCRMGVCGSCGMMVNGVPKLTCAAFLRDYLPGPIRVEPLAYFPVIRDLVVDIEDFMGKLRRVMPWIIRRTEQPLTAGEYRQTPAQLEAYKQFSMCINCMLCYAACPVYGLSPLFIGPAAIALGYRYNLDSRDEGYHLRQPILAEAVGVWQCTFVGECSAVCPKGVDPAAAIQRSKVAGAKDWFLSILLPRGGRS